MNIVLTGHKGYIGQLLMPHLERLVEKSQFADMPTGDVRGFSLSYTTNQAAWETEFERVFDWDINLVIHAATERLQRHEQGRQDAESIFASNYHCTKQIAKAAQQNSAKLIFTSTCSSIEPFSFYTWSKRCSADLIMAMLQDSCVLNVYTVFGKEGTGNNKESPIRKLMNGSLPYCFHPILRDYIHVTDVISAILYVIEKEIVGEYDLGTGNGVSTKELIDLWGRYHPPVIGRDHPDWPAGIHQTLVARREKMLPGFIPEIDVREWLRTQSVNESIIEQDNAQSVSYSKSSR